jgi:DNA-binding MarR family transcriptional regulator
MPPVSGPADAGATAVAHRQRRGIDRVVVAYERFQARLMTVHAAELVAMDLTMAQAKLLYLVVAREALSLTEIAALLGISASTASGAVDRLVDLELLSREAVPTNRRQVTVAATPAGVEAIERFHELGTTQLRDFLAPVSDADLAVVERALDILTAAVPAPDEGPTTTGSPS